MLILLCDDHVLLVEALGSLLRAAGHTVETAHSPEEAATVVGKTSPDVCVMDVGFPGGSSLDGLAKVRELSPETRVLMLSAVEDPDTIAGAVDLGAAGYVCKDAGVADIIRAVERVYDGETVLGPKVARVLARRSEVDPEDIQWLVAFLTRREREVLRRIVLGQSTVEMAKSMGISRSTARTHVQNVLQKLGVHSRLQAVAAVSRSQADPSWLTAGDSSLRHVK
jgi:two-component system, NarL family, nitrate/nitrite response regulator NarL